MEKNTASANQPLNFNLQEISNWQLQQDDSTNSVELPSLQRGFVWKASQIESLWDSILRGYPIGAFLLSKSEDDKLFLLDGQQRATSVAIGFYNPWRLDENKFWSVKDVPVAWIDLIPAEKTITQKFVIRVVTQSHPWGYQRKNHNTILSVSDRSKALEIFKHNENNKEPSYFNFSKKHVFPYDANLPVPLAFLIQSILESGSDWKNQLVNLCEESLHENIYTKYFHNEDIYIEKLKSVLFDPDFNDADFVKGVENIRQIQVPGIVVSQDVLKAEDEQSETDPTLFVRLNSSGTRIAGDELIYSIYKASFKEAKQLVENIGSSFMSAPMVISIVSRLVLSELENGQFPYSLNVNGFRNKIKDNGFKEKMREWIGDDHNSPAANLFKRAFDILQSKGNFNMPPVLVKKMVKDNPEVFLLLLRWLNSQTKEITKEQEKKILATFTSLAWFGIDNVRYVREIWSCSHEENLWSKTYLSRPFLHKEAYFMYPLIQPQLFRAYLIKSVVEEDVQWEKLYPADSSEILKIYRGVLKVDMEDEEKLNGARELWARFINKLIHSKSFLLFVQRDYINKKFVDYNQLTELEDTNVPWDWDHIYPNSWVYSQWHIHTNVRHWNNTIGNYRALSLEENRSEGNKIDPAIRLEKEKVRENSFIKDDWSYWSKIDAYFNEKNDASGAMRENYLNAVIHRLCNIYQEWYDTFDIGSLFGFEANEE